MVSASRSDFSESFKFTILNLPTSFLLTMLKDVQDDGVGGRKCHRRQHGLFLRLVKLPQNFSGSMSPRRELSLVGPEKSSEKNTEPTSVVANNPLLKRERRAWHNSSNDNKGYAFFVNSCAHALSLGPLSNSMRDGTAQLLPVCTICPMPVLLIGRNVNTLSGLTLQQMGGGI